MHIKGNPQEALQGLFNILYQTANSKVNNKTRSTFPVSQIAADQMDAVRKTFNVQVLHFLKGRGGSFVAAVFVSVMLSCGLFNFNSS